MNNMTYGFADELMKIAVGKLPPDAGSISEGRAKIKTPSINEQVKKKVTAPAKKKVEESSDIADLAGGSAKALGAAGRLAIKAPLAIGEGVYSGGKALLGVAGEGLNAASDVIGSATKDDTGKTLLGAGALALLGRRLLRKAL